VSSSQQPPEYSSADGEQLLGHPLIPSIRNLLVSVATAAAQASADFLASVEAATAQDGTGVPAWGLPW
jgi:hypothetical protein